MKDDDSLYDKIPIRMLAGFYYHITKNIEDGILSDAMYHELNLIEQVATKKGIPFEYLYKRGSFMK